MVRDFLSHPRTGPAYYARVKPRLPGLKDLRVKPRHLQVLIGTRLSVFWPDEDKYFNGEVVQHESENGTHTIQYDDGDTECLILKDETYEILSTPKIRAKKLVPWSFEIKEYLTRELAEALPTQQEVDDVVELVSSSLADNTVNNYESKMRRFKTFCSHRGLTTLPASKATGLLYMRDLHDCPTI